MGLIIEAAHYAALAHAGQTRKYNKGPYIFHPMRVAGRTSLLASATDELVAAAWLHDVIEDCGKTREGLSGRFGEMVAGYVAALTNPSKQFPAEPRAERKAMDRAHIAGRLPCVQEVKLIDRIDNLRELGSEDRNFITLYVEESRLLAEAIGQYINPVLYTELMALCSDLRGK